jgi:hypothetical protein
MGDPHCKGFLLYLKKERKKKAVQREAKGTKQHRPTSGQEKLHSTEAKETRRGSLKRGEKNVVFLHKV